MAGVRRPIGNVVVGDVLPRRVFARPERAVRRRVGKGAIVDALDDSIDRSNVGIDVAAPGIRVRSDRGDDPAIVGSRRVNHDKAPLASIRPVGTPPVATMGQP